MNSVDAPLGTRVPLVIGSGDAPALASGVREKAVPWVLSLGVLLVYLFFPTRNYYWDGIDFALVIEQSRGLSTALIHPHHLLYNVFGFFVYHAFSAAGWELRAVHALQYANAFLSALSALLLYRFLRHSFRSIFLSSLLTLLFSFSATWWKYSTDADAYVPCVLLLLLCLNLLFAGRKPRPWAVALAHTAAMCMHQLAVFFYPVAVLALLLHDGGPTFRRRLIPALKYSAAASSLTLAAYYYGFHLQTGAHGLTDFAAWLTSYLHGPQGYSLGFDLRDVVVNTFRGHTRLFFQGRFNWLEGLLRPPVLALLTGLIAVFSFLVFQSIRGARSLIISLKSAAPLEGMVRPVVAACSLWACVYFIFLCFWYPYFYPYRLFYLPALILLLGVALTRYNLLGSPRRRRFAALFVAAMATSNFLFFIYPLSHVEKNPAVAMAVGMHRTWPPGTVIFYAGQNSDDELFRYFNTATEWRKLDSADAGPSEEALAEIYRRGGTAWVDASAIDRMRSSPEGSRWLAEHSERGRSAELVKGGFRIIFVQILPRPDDAGTKPADGFERGGPSE